MRSSRVGSRFRQSFVVVLNRLPAFRQKMRVDSLQQKGRTDPKAYEESVKLGNEVATVLRRNFVQAHRVDSGADERWSEYAPFFSVHYLTLSPEIRFTEHTEMGNNDSIKNPPPMPGKGRRVKCVQSPLLPFPLGTYLNRCCSE